MGKLLARIRAMSDTAQKMVVFGVLTGMIAAIVIVLQALG